MIGKGRWREVALLTAVAAALAITSACSSSGDGGSGGSTPAPNPSTNNTASATTGSSTSAKDLLPADIKSKGVVVVATESSYPPFVYAGEDGKTLVGVDIDLGDAMADILGVKFEWKVSNFDGIIPGVDAGRFDMSFDALTDTPKRQQQQNFLDYVKTGSGVFVPEANPLNVTGEDESLCGHSIGVVRGTVQADEAVDVSKKCTDAGKTASKIDNYPTEEAMFLALTSGRNDAIIVSASVGNYAAQQSGEKFKQVGDLYGQQGSVQGMTFKKDNTQLLKAMEAALQELMDNGKYLEIMKKYDMESVAMDKATINNGLGLG